MSDVLVDSKMTKKEITEWFPHLDSLNPNTKFQVYVTPPNAKRGVYELTVFYRQPLKDKMRIDAEFDPIVAQEGRQPGAREIRIIQWGLATAPMEEKK